MQITYSLIDWQKKWTLREENGVLGRFQDSGRAVVVSSNCISSARTTDSAVCCYWCYIADNHFAHFQYVIYIMCSSSPEIWFLFCFKTCRFFFLLAPAVRLVRRTKSNTVLLSGLSGSGKTVLFYQVSTCFLHVEIFLAVDCCPSQDEWLDGYLAFTTW